MHEAGDRRYSEIQAQRVVAMTTRAYRALRDATQQTPDDATRALLARAEAACAAAQACQEAWLVQLRKRG